MASLDPQVMPGYPQPPVKRGMSSGMKVLIVLLVVFGILVILCCGGIGGFYWWASNTFKQDPASVKATTAEIADIEIPDGFEPAGAMDMKIPFAGQRAMAMVVYTAPESSLLLVTVGEGVSDKDRENMQRGMEQSLQSQGVDQKGRKMEVAETEKVERQIRGKSATFTIQTGKSPDGGKRVRVAGAFNGKTGPTTLLLDADADVVSAEEAKDMIESIK